MRSQEQDRPWAALVAGAVLLFALVPSWQVGFFSDDFLRSLRVGLQLEQGVDRLGYLVALHHEVVENGRRFIPVHFLLFTTTWTSDASVHRAAITALTLAVFALAALFVRRLEASRVLGLWAVALGAAFLQLRSYHDPVLGFGGQMQGIFALNLGAALCLDEALRRRSRAFAALGGALYLLALWSYELSFLLAPLLVLVALQHRERSALVVAPFVVALAVGVGTTAWALSHDAGAYQGTRVGGLEPVLRTLAMQLWGTVPLTDQRVRPTLSLTPWTVALVALYVAGFALLARLTRWESLRASRWAWAAAALLFIAPALPIAISAKYQQELRWGLAYLPTFVSRFGLSMLVVLAVVQLPWGQVRTRGFVLAVLAGITAGLQHAANAETCRAIAREAALPRSFEERALARGWMEGLPRPSGLIVTFTHDLERVQPGWAWYNWDHPAFYLQHAGVNPGWVLAQGLVRRADLSEAYLAPNDWETLDTRELWALHYELAAGGGFGWLAPVERTPDGALRPRGPVRIYAEGLAALELAPSLVVTLPTDRPWARVEVEVPADLDLGALAPKPR